MNPPSGSGSYQVALTVLQTLRRSGCTAYFAGGCVRDMLLNRTPKDYDIATSASPGQIMLHFPHTLDIGKAFGVIQVLLDGSTCEVATFRRDCSYEDGRRPSTVEFCDAREDVLRRDFTINGLLYDPEKNEVIDYVEGQKDLAARVLRTIGPPDARFGEDYLRMLRAIRFSSALGFAIAPDAMEAIRRHARKIEQTSAERIQQEISRMLLESPKPGQGIALLHEAGLLEVLLPEVARMAGQEQPPRFHPEGDVLTHTINMLDGLKNPSLELAYAVLLHDVGKPLTAHCVPEPDGSQRIRFDGHAKVGAELADTILRRLRLPVQAIEIITHCIRDHMRFMDVQSMRRSTLRQLIGSPTFPIELELHRLDCVHSHGDLSNRDFLLRFIEELQHEPVLPKPWITGKELLELGLEEGPAVGHWIKQAYEAQLENRFADREALLTWLRSELAQVDRPR